MKVTIQTLKGTKHPIDISETDTVGGVKQAIASQLSIDVNEQKLIFLGKILTDDSQSISELKIVPNATIVVMTSKVKAKPPVATQPTPAASTAAAAPGPAAPAPGPQAPVAATPTPVAASTAVAVVHPPAPVAQTPAGAPAAAGSLVAVNAASSVQMGAAYEESLLGLMSLGFERQQAVDAMRAAYNNADRAAEYLFGPESVLRAALAQAGGGGGGGNAARVQAQAQPQGQVAAPPSVAANPPPSGQPAQQGPSANELMNLASAHGVDQAQINQLRGMLQSNPSLGPLLLQQIAQSSPELMAQLGNNPQALEQMLQGLGGAGGGAGGQAGGHAHGGAGGGGRGHRTIQVTPEENAQLDNLTALGFSRNAALEAWLICDRNQEQAAAYLFEHGGDIPMDDVGGDGEDDGDYEDGDEDMGGGGAGHDGQGGAGGGDDDDDDENIDGPFYE